MYTHQGFDGLVSLLVENSFANSVPHSRDSLNHGIFLSLLPSFLVVRNLRAIPYPSVIQRGESVYVAHL